MHPVAAAFTVVMAVAWLVTVGFVIRFIKRQRRLCLVWGLVLVFVLQEAYLALRLGLSASAIPILITRLFLFVHYTIAFCVLWILGMPALQIQMRYQCTCVFAVILLFLQTILLFMFLFPHQQPLSMLIHISDTILIYAVLVTLVILLWSRNRINLQWVTLGCLLLSTAVSILPLMWSLFLHSNSKSNSSDSNQELDLLVLLVRVLAVWIALGIAFWVQQQYFPTVFKSAHVPLNSQRHGMRSRRHTLLPSFDREQVPLYQIISLDSAEPITHNSDSEHDTDVETEASWDAYPFHSPCAELLNAVSISPDQSENPCPQRLWKIQSPPVDWFAPLAVSIGLQGAPLTLAHLLCAPDSLLPTPLVSLIQQTRRTRSAATLVLNAKMIRSALLHVQPDIWQQHVAQIFDSFHSRMQGDAKTVPLHVLEWLLIQISLVCSHGDVSGSFPFPFDHYLHTARYLVSSLVQDHVIKHLADDSVIHAGHDTLFATSFRSLSDHLIIPAAMGSSSSTTAQSEQFLLHLLTCRSLHTVAQLHRQYLNQHPALDPLDLIDVVERKIKEQKNGTAFWFRLQIPTSASFTTYPWYPLMRWIMAKSKRDVAHERLGMSQNPDKFESAVREVEFQLNEMLLQCATGDKKSPVSMTKPTSESENKIPDSAGLESSSSPPSVDTPALHTEELKAWLHPIRYAHVRSSATSARHDARHPYSDAKTTAKFKPAYLSLWACLIWCAGNKTEWSLWRTETILILYVHSIKDPKERQRLRTLLTWVDSYRAETPTRLSLERVLHSTLFSMGPDLRVARQVQESIQSTCSYLLQIISKFHVPVSYLHDRESIRSFLLLDVKRRAVEVGRPTVFLLHQTCLYLCATVNILMALYPLHIQWKDWKVYGERTADIEDFKEDSDDMQEPGFLRPSSMSASEGSSSFSSSSTDQKTLVAFLSFLIGPRSIDTISLNSEGQPSAPVPMSFVVQSLCECIIREPAKKYTEDNLLSWIEYAIILICGFFDELESGRTLSLAVLYGSSSECRTNIRELATAYQKTQAVLPTWSAGRRDSVIGFMQTRALVYHQAQQYLHIPVYVTNPWAVPEITVDIQRVSAPPSGRVTPRMDIDEDDAPLVHSLSKIEFAMHSVESDDDNGEEVAV